MCNAYNGWMWLPPYFFSINKKINATNVWGSQGPTACRISCRCSSILASAVCFCCVMWRPGCENDVDVRRMNINWTANWEDETSYMYIAFFLYALQVLYRFYGVFSVKLKRNVEPLLNFCKPIFISVTGCRKKRRCHKTTCCSRWENNSRCKGERAAGHQ